MKAAASVAAATLACHAVSAEKTASPIAKVLDLLAGLETKIISEGEVAQKEYEELAEWCEDRSKNVGFEIKTGESDSAGLKASIEKEVALQSSLETKIEELSSGIATDEADLSAATEIRSKESTDFKAEEKELVEIKDMLERAIGVLERELQKGGSSLLQGKSLSNIVQVMGSLVQAAEMSSADAKRLTALVQQNSGEGEDASDEDESAPAAAVYENHSGGVIDTLEDLLQKAQDQLADARKKETAALHNFEMLKQSLSDQLKFANKDMGEAKKGLADSKEKEAVATGDLQVTTKDLEEDKTTKRELKQTCMTRSQDFEAAVKSRAEELKALATAKAAIQEKTGGAGDVLYSSASSFLQVNGASSIASNSDLANFEAVRYVRDLARKQNDPSLAQLASRMAAAMRLGSNSADPFAKVKGLIQDMLDKLEKEGQQDATHKAYCDKELSESKTAKGEKEYDVEKLTTKIDQMVSRSAQLKEEVAGLNKELFELTKAQAEMDTMRSSEKEVFTHDKKELSEGLDGVKIGLKVLREYYAQAADAAAHSAAGGASTGIIGMLEVVESDMVKGLAERQSTEDNAQAIYDQESQKNKLDGTMKKKDVEYKEKEAVGLDKSVVDAKSDRSSVQAELDAVNEYLAKLEDMCIAKPEAYSEKKRRREEEIAGLKEALKILEGEAVLLQSQRRMLRGVRAHNVV